MNIYCIALIFLLACSAECIKVLVVFPAPARSHYNLGSALARGLADRGHDVTIISPFSEKEKPKNGTYREIVLTGYIEEIQAARGPANMFEMGQTNIIFMSAFMLTMMSKMTELSLSHPNVQELLKSGETFDIVLVEQFMNDAQKAFAKHFGANLVTFSTVGANSWLNPLMGNPQPLSYVPELLLSYSSHMTFWQRVSNTLFWVWSQSLHHLLVYPQQDKLIKKWISNDIDLEDVLYNSSIALLNSHPAMNQPVPLVPAMIEIGGFHVKPSGKLPADLQKYLDDSKEGVVYFSMGSNLKSKDLPLEKRDALLKVFSKLKQKVLWKWEDDELPGKPANVKVQKWMPQQEILAHKNVKVFITHGGLLSTTETTYHGVPILAIPIFGDQKINAQYAVGNGIGLSLPYGELSEENLEAKLNELLNNPKYYRNAKHRAELFHDRQRKPLDTAVYWIEYVARHGGAEHLRVAALDLPWYKYLLLDVVAFFILLSLPLLYLNLIILKKLCRKFGLCRCKSKTADKNKKHN